MPTSNLITDIWYDMDNGRLIQANGLATPAKPVLPYSMLAIFVYHLRTATNTAWTGLAATDTAAWCTRANYNRTQSPVQRVHAEDITIDHAAGTITVVVDLLTSAFNTLIGSDQTKPGFCELRIFNVGQTQPSRMIDLAVTYQNALDDDATPDPSAPAVNVYTIAQVDSLLAAKAALVGAADIEITDYTKGIILRTLAGSRGRVTIVDLPDGNLAFNLAKL